jgi:hypothetical protein
MKSYADPGSELSNKKTGGEAKRLHVYEILIMC